jgi:hypothetical protein
LLISGLARYLGLPLVESALAAGVVAVLVSWVGWLWQAARNRGAASTSADWRREKLWSIFGSLTVRPASYTLAFYSYLSVPL